jgi:hypothetical protein
MEGESTNQNIAVITFFLDVTSFIKQYMFSCMKKFTSPVFTFRLCQSLCNLTATFGDFHSPWIKINTMLHKENITFIVELNKINDFCIIY